MHLDLKKVNRTLQEISKLTKKPLEIELSSNDKLSPLYFDKKSSRLGTKSSLLSRSNNFIHRLFTPKHFEKTGWYSNVSISLVKSLNGFIVLNHEKGLSIKVLHKDREPLFVPNEKIANTKLPLHTLEIREQGAIADYNFVIQPMVTTYQEITWDKWPSTAPNVFELVHRSEFYQDLQKSTFKTEEDKLRQYFSSHYKNFPYLQEEFQKASSLILRLIEKYSLPIECYNKFSHGDLTINNIFKKDPLLLFDWANGGYLDIFYDLMIQSFYFVDAKAWKNFTTVDFHSQDADVFWGQSKLYVELIEKNLNKKFSNDEIRLHLILSLAQVLIKNFERYQTTEELEDGRIILKNVEMISQNILANTL